MSAKLYKLGPDGVIKKLVNGKYSVSFILDSGCGEDLEYKAWLADGNTPDAADPEPEVVRYIPKLVIVDRLEAIGKRAMVKDALVQSDYALDRWNASTEIDVNDAQVRALLSSLDIDPDTILY